MRPVWVIALLSVIGIGFTARFVRAQSAGVPHGSPDPAFEQMVKPFLMQNCQRCHNVDNGTAGVRVDLLDAKFDDQQVRPGTESGEGLNAGTMPPKGLPQPDVADRQRVAEWIARNLEIARLRPSPKNGLVRRLTVAQYRNTLRELLLTR